MDLKKLRDELVLQKGAYNEAVKNNKLAVEELLGITKTFSTEKLSLLKEMKIDTDRLFNIDIELLTTDKEYLDSFKSFVNSSAELLESHLVEVLKD